jgi:hypothetical protein
MDRQPIPDEPQTGWIIRQGLEVQRVGIVAVSTLASEAIVCGRLPDGGLVLIHPGDLYPTRTAATVALLRKAQIEAAAHTAKATRLMAELAAAAGVENRA